MSSPPYWSSSWRRNYDSILDWSKCALSLLSLSQKEYPFYLHRQVHRIEGEEERDLFEMHGSNMLDLLEWIEEGIDSLRELKVIGEEFKLNRVSFSAFQEEWFSTCVTGDRKTSSKLKKALESVIKDVASKMEAFDQESDEYSSYSDSSESTSTSDSEGETVDRDEDDEEDEDDEDDDQGSNATSTTDSLASSSS